MQAGPLSVFRRASDARHRVLVVDEDLVERAATVAQLSDFALIDVASSAHEALAHTSAGPPDLMVVDLALLDALRARPELARVPMLVLAPRNEAGFELRALERGAIDAVAKPVAHSPLRARVRTHLRVRSLSNELHAAASTDALTGLRNRRAFFRHLNTEHERCVREKQAMHLLLIELDDLVAFRARYGRAAADACLTRVAQAVAQNVREDDVVARIEGAHIAVLLHDSTTPGAATVARRLGDAVRALAIQHEPSSAGIMTASVVIGCLAPSVEGARHATRLVDATERALAQAKDGDRGQIWFYDVAS